MNANTSHKFSSSVSMGHVNAASAGITSSLDEVDNETSSRTYVPGDPINDIPSLSPPPYKGPGSTGGSSTTSNSGGRSGITGLGKPSIHLKSH